MSTKKLLSQKGSTREIEHHAYLLEASFSDKRALIEEKLSELLGISFVRNPDLFILATSSFGIDDARNAITAQSLRPIQNEIRPLLLAFDHITYEAQNALLKCLEEPGRASVFVLITPNSGNFLPTLRSRLFDLDIDKTLSGVSHLDASVFLSESITERRKHIDSIVSEKNKAAALKLLADIETQLATQTPLPRQTLSQIITCRKALQGRSAPLKMILEHFAYTIPHQTSTSTHA